MQRFIIFSVNADDWCIFFVREKKKGKLSFTAIQNVSVLQLRAKITNNSTVKNFHFILLFKTQQNWWVTNIYTA